MSTATLTAIAEGAPAATTEPELLSLPDSPKAEKKVKIEAMVPDWLKVLGERFKGLAQDDPTETCKWLGIPHSDQCPSPGQARTWGVNEWTGWAETNGFISKGETAHNFAWEHDKIPALVLGIAKTPGDWRSSMNTGMQIRRYVRMFATRAHFIVRKSLEKGVPVKASDESIFQDFILQSVQEKDFGARAWGFTEIDDGQSVYNAGQMRRLMAKVVSEFPGVSPRNAVASLLKGLSNGDLGDFGLEAVDKVFEFIKLAADEAAIPSEIYESLSDHLLLLRATELAEKESKRLKRETEIAEKEAAKARSVSPAGILRAKATENALATQRQIQAALAAAQSTIDRLRAITVPVLSIPDFEDPAPFKTRATSLEKDLAGAFGSRDAALAKSDALEARLAAIDFSKVAAAEEVQNHLVALAGLVVEGVKAARMAGPFQIADIFNSLSNEAQSVLDKYPTVTTKPVDPVVAP